MRSRVRSPRDAKGALQQIDSLQSADPAGVGARATGEQMDPINFDFIGHVGTRARSNAHGVLLSEDAQVAAPTPPGAQLGTMLADETTSRNRLFLELARGA